MGLLEEHLFADLDVQESALCDYYQIAPIYDLLYILELFWRRFAILFRLFSAALILCTCSCLADATPTLSFNCAGRGVRVGAWSVVARWRAARFNNDIFLMTDIQKKGIMLASHSEYARWQGVHVYAPVVGDLGVVVSLIRHIKQVGAVFDRLSCATVWCDLICDLLLVFFLRGCVSVGRCCCRRVHTCCSYHCWWSWR